MMKKTSIHDVAKEAGVSIATVSKALNNSPVVTPATRQKVIEASQRLNYVPNRVSKQLKSGQTQTICFYTNSIEAPYFASFADAIAREVGKRGYNLNIFLSANRQQLMESILGSAMDGLIGFVDLLDERDIQLLKDYHIKAVFIDRAIKAETIGSVIFDSYQKGKELTEYLIEMGHKRIIFLKSFDGVFDSDERLRGYKDALKEASIEYDPKLILQGNFSKQFSYVEMKNYCQNLEEDIPTAVFAGNDMSAVGAIQALQESGYHVPNDVSVVGFDDSDLLEYFKPRLTTINNPIDLQGQIAVDQLFRLIEGSSVGKTIELSGKLVIRESSKSIN